MTERFGILRRASGLRRALGFAQAVAARFRRHGVVVSRLGLVFAARRVTDRPQVLHEHQHHRHAQVRLAPRIHLTLVQTPWPVGVARRAQPLHPLSATRRARPSPLSYAVLGKAEPFVRRAVGRGERVDAVPGITPTQRVAPVEALVPGRSRNVLRLAPGAGISIAQPVPMVVPRPPASTAHAGDQTPRLETVAPAGHGTPSQVQAEEPVDVRRLTDDVIDAIDARIVAERERLGRI